MSVSSTKLLPKLDAILYQRRAGENIIGAAIAEIERLRTLIYEHNQGHLNACDWRRKNETHPGSDGKPLSNCESYTARGRLCPDCPKHDMIETEQGQET